MLLKQKVDGVVITETKKNVKAQKNFRTLALHDIQWPISELRNKELVWE